MDDLEFSWQKSFSDGWRSIPKDDIDCSRSSNLESKIISRHLNQIGRVKLSMVRYTSVIIDASSSALNRDWNQSSCIFEEVIKYCKEFVEIYFDRNPISSLGFLSTRDGVSEIISDMSGNSKFHLDNLNISKIKSGGDPSLQNVLLLSISQLNSLVGKGTKEIIVIYSGLNTCDPGDIFSTISSLEKEHIRVSVICLSGELYICRMISERTHGFFAVALDGGHFRELLMRNIDPPPIVTDRPSWNLLRMGFPQQTFTSYPTLCACHSKSTRVSYICPVCNTKLCTLPTDCIVCGLTLISSFHLAKSYHRLFPIKSFVPVEQNGYITCLSCRIQVKENISKCSECSNLFCNDCNLFIHDSVYTCPGCC
jgi:transcription initiation factor TFIIH subunit 2